MNNSKLTICLVTYNGAKFLPVCLDSVFKQSFKDWRLLIMDNNSGDDSAKITTELVKNNSQVTLFPVAEKNIGFAGGYNKLIKQANSKYVMLLNQDIILKSDYIEKIIDFLDNNHRTGAVIGKILRWNLDKSQELTNISKTSNIDTAGLRIFPSFRVVDMGSGEKDNGEYNATERIFGVSGCLPVYRKKALEEVSYFDNNFFSYKEDVDLAFRLHNANWEAYRMGDAVAYHERGVAGDEKLNDIGVAVNRKDKSATERYLSYRNHLYVLIKNLSITDFLHYGIFIIFYELKKFIYILLLEQKTLLAWKDVVKNLSELLRQRNRRKLKSVKEWIR